MPPRARRSDPTTTTQRIIHPGSRQARRSNRASKSHAVFTEEIQKHMDRQKLLQQLDTMRKLAEKRPPANFEMYKDSCGRLVHGNMESFNQPMAEGAFTHPSGTQYNLQRLNGPMTVGIIKNPLVGTSPWIERVNGKLDEQPCEAIPRVPISMVVLGPPGKGKTTLLQTLLLVYSKVFDRIIVVNPNVLTDAKWIDIVDAFYDMQRQRKDGEECELELFTEVPIERLAQISTSFRDSMRPYSTAAKLTQTQKDNKDGTVKHLNFDHDRLPFLNHQLYPHSRAPFLPTKADLPKIQVIHNDFHPPVDKSWRYGDGKPIPAGASSTYILSMMNRDPMRSLEHIQAAVNQEATNGAPQLSLSIPRSKSTLIILDDVMGLTNSSSSASYAVAHYLRKAIASMRHEGCAFIFGTQYLRDMDTGIRKCLYQLVAFQTACAKEKDAILTDFGNIPDLEEKYDIATAPMEGEDESKNFMMAHMDTQKVYRNLECEIISSRPRFKLGSQSTNVLV